MTRLQKLQLEQSEIRQKIGESLDIPEADRSESYSADLDKLTKRALALEVELRAATVAGEESTTEESTEETTTEETTDEDAEAREMRELRERVEFAPYVAAAMASHGLTGGPELEYNQALSMGSDRFPLELLARELDAELETRAAIDGDGRTNQGSWIDRLFADTAAARLGITMPSVGAGVSAYPVITSDAAPAQRGRTEAAVAATISATVTEIKPTRNSVHAVYSIEDDARLPGLADAIMRDLRGAMVEAVDRAVFVGDDGANEAAADIAGLTTATGITELTLSQANKIKADEILKVLLGLVDGVYAASLDDVRIVASVGSNQLWGGTIHAPTLYNQTVAQFLRENGASWTTRGTIETATTAGKFGAFVGLRRGIRNAAVAPVWAAGQLIRDPYSGAKSGEVQLTLHYLWGFKIPRVANFRRLKYVS